MRKYRLWKKSKKCLKTRKIVWTVTCTRTWDGDALKGRIYRQFVGLGYQCFLHTKIKEIQEQLELSLSDKNLAEKEKEQDVDLLKWLKKQSMQSLIDWFDCIEMTNLRSEDRTVTQTSGDTKRTDCSLPYLGYWDWNRSRRIS